MVKIRISNIVTAHYTFNSFITSLREHMQLKLEVSSTSSKTNPTHHTTYEDTYAQQYGRNSRFVKKYPREDPGPTEMKPVQHHSGPSKKDD